LSVEDHEFGLDPQRWVGVALPEAPTTGSVISLATISRLGDVEIGIVCLVKDDTTNTHGRWAIKEALREGMLSGYDFLASGAVSGELPQRAAAANAVRGCNIDTRSRGMDAGWNRRGSADHQSARP
jgi:hypothetical protein